VLASSLGTHRLIPTLRTAEHVPFTLRRFAGEVRNVMAIRSYRILLIASLFASVATGFSDSLGLYMNTYFWELSSAQIGVLVNGFVLALLLGVAMARPLSERFAGIAIDLVRFPTQAAIGAVPPETVRALGLAVGPGLMIFYVLTLLVVARYPITRAAHRHVRAELDRRRRGDS